MEILGIDLGNTFVRICVLSVGCCSLPLVLFALLSRLTGGRLSVLPVLFTITPLFFGQIFNFFGDRLDRSNPDADEIAEKRVGRTRSTLRDKLNAANSQFNAQVSSSAQSGGAPGGGYPGQGNDPLDPRQFTAQSGGQPAQPNPNRFDQNQFGTPNAPRRPGRRPGNVPGQRGGAPQGGQPPQNAPQQNDPLAFPPPQRPAFRRGGQPPQNPQRGGQPPQNPQRGGQQGGDPRFSGGVDPLAGPPPGNAPKPPLRNRYDRRSDDPFETAGGVRSPQGDDIFGPASLPGLAGRDFSDTPRRNNPRRDTRKREHNDDEIFGGFFDDDGDGFSDY